MTHLVVLFLSTGAFAALALAMERHQEDLFGRALAVRTSRWLRAAGGALLLVALQVIVTAQGWGVGLVSLSGHTSLGAGLVFGALILHARRKLRGQVRR